MPRQVSSVQRRLFRQQRLWMQLAAYRPLAVLAGIWIGLLAIALLAYGQLMHTTNNQADTTAPAATDVYPHERMNGTTADNPPPLADEAEGDRAAATATDRALEPTTVNGLSGWTLLALVGGCAGGCWLLSVLIKMPRRPKQQRPKRGPVAQQKYRLAASKRRPPRSQPAALQGATPEPVPKLDVYDPEQPLVAPAQRSTSTSPRPPASPPAPAPAPAAEPAVTVVSDQVQHRLDWPSDSLVNTADVRQRRSLSSFM